MIATPVLEQPFDWARLVLAVRRARGWAQRELASCLGVSAATVANWERGRASPNVRDMPLLRAMAMGWDDTVSAQLRAIGEIEASARRGELTPEQMMTLKYTLEEALRAIVEKANG